ncbi:MAG: preprotein translocase subunit SecG [Parcubacteria group bacterium]|nr:preprotein translocase subunit SecG [Parcubacteria group bacterium]
MNIDNLLTIAEVLIAACAIVLILLQQRGTALGSAFGGGEGTSYATRRGVQKYLLWGTIVCLALFVGLALVSVAI